MADIFKLVGSIFVDTDKANDSLQKTDKKAQGVGETFSKVAGGAAKVGTAVVGMATAAVGGMVSLASETASSMDVIDKASMRMGISAESYQELAHAAGLSGIEMSTMEKAAKKLEGTDLNMEDALNQIMELGSAEERTAKASELFGESIAYSLEPLLQSSGEDFKAMKQEARDLGLVMSGDTVKAGATLNDTLNNIKDSFGAVGAQIGGALLPLIQDFADEILEMMPFIQDTLGQVTPILIELFQQLMPPLMDLAKQLLPVIMDLIKALLPVFMDLFNAIMPIVMLLIEALAPILKDLMPIITTVANILVTVLGAAFEVLKPIIDNVINIFGGLIKFISGIFTGDWKKAWEGITDIFKGIINIIPSVLEGVINGAIALINGLIGGINKITDKLGWKEIKLIEEVKIPRLEKGGILEKGEIGLLEGNGAEAVVPLEKNKAWISAVARDMGDTMGGGRVEELLEELIAKIDNLDMSMLVKVVPEPAGIFSIVREESRRNKRRGGAPIEV